jgi:hypothetical protein
MSETSGFALPSPVRIGSRFRRVNVADTTSCQEIATRQRAEDLWKAEKILDG